MSNYYLDLLKDFKSVEHRAEVYEKVIKEHREILKNCPKDSKEYAEIVEMVKFIKNMDDYKKVNKKMASSLFGLADNGRP